MESARLCLESGDIVWCQLKCRRFWNLHLVISKEVAESVALVGDKIFVDLSLKGNSQYLLLPAVRRRCSAGFVTPTVQSTVTLGQLNVAGDMSSLVSGNLLAFFHGLDEPGEMMVELRSHAVHIHDPPKDFHTRDDEVVPLALPGCRRESRFRHLTCMGLILAMMLSIFWT